MKAWACSISNATDRNPEHFDRREKEYSQCIERLGGVEIPARLLSVVTLALEADPNQDFLGRIYMNLDLGSHWHGQFFTPYDVCVMMARITIEAGIEQMRNRPEIDYQLGDLLARTRLSQSSLAQKFKQIVGLPPHAFLLACRIQRAKELLVQTDRLVTDIAAELKFSSSQHFATCFKQETGVSPRDWRTKR